MVILAREKLAFGLLLFVAAAFSLLRVRPTDTPWHMATARYAYEQGHWPTQNTFSYTFPEYPLYQQYPVYQSLLYFTHRLAGWEGLSLLHSVAWTLIFALWVRWGAPWRYAAVLSLAYLIALLGLQRRMVLRPDIMSLFLFAALLHLLDAYRRGKMWPLFGVVFVQWLWANSHQLFPLGLAVQVAFLGHLIVSRWLHGRWGVTTEDNHLPIWPALLALAGSLVACLGTPIGLEMLWAPLQTAGSLEHHREHVSEFRRITADTYALQLVVIAGVLAVIGFVKRRHHWSLFELGLFLMGTALVAAAQRGAAFFILIAVGIFARSATYPWQRNTDLSPETPGVLSLRSVSPIVCIALSLFFLEIRWNSPIRSLTDTQPGIGRALGMFPDPAIAFLKKHPPPGRLLNLGWYAGNMLVWELYPSQPVFVDPRFEAYPRDFLLSTIHAMEDDAQLDQLIEAYDPGWMVAELRLADVRQRVARLLRRGDWQLVHADTVWLILVRKTPQSADYLMHHAKDPQQVSFEGLLESHPTLRKLQQEEIDAFRELVRG